MNGQAFGGGQMALDTMRALQDKRVEDEKHEMGAIFNMARIDPKGAANAWNRSYFGMKYGPITYAGAKGDWVAYKDGSGKLYSMNRTTGEFNEGIGAGKPGVTKSLFDRQTPTVQGDIVTELGHVPTSDRETEVTLQKVGIKRADVKAQAAADAELARLRKMPEIDREELYARDPLLKDAAENMGYESFDEMSPQEQESAIRDIELGRQREAQGIAGKVVHEGPYRGESGIARRQATIAGNAGPAKAGPARIRVLIMEGPEKGKRYEIDDKDFDPSWMKKI